MFPHVLNGYAYPTKTNNKFTVNLDTLPKNPETYYLESLRAAELVWDQRQGKVYLLYSGGVDSEYTFNLFLSLGMPVIPVILCLKPDYNTHDISYALDFCESKNIKPVIIDLDFDKFVDSGKFLEISIAAQSEIYHLAATAWAAEQLYGTVLMGDGEPYIKLQPDKTWNVEIMEFDYAITRYFEKKGIYGLPHFNIYTPGQFSSFIQDPRMRELANNEHPGKLGSHSSKGIIYNRTSPWQMATRTKYTGYEVIEKSPIFQHPDIQLLANIGQQWNGKFTMNYFDFISKIVCG